ncbi:MAG: helix-turn-helix domain-containing protein [Flavisolibacter sp.]
MSSNIRVNKICVYCRNEFEARKTTSKTCSDHCAKMYYKERQRTAKIEVAKAETERIKSKPVQELKEKEFLTVTQVSKLLNCSRQNVYKLINNGKLKATNLLLKKTIVKRSDIDKLFA